MIEVEVSRSAVQFGRSAVKVGYKISLLELSLSLSTTRVKMTTIADHAARLEPFVLLAKSSRGAAAAKTIVNAISAVSSAGLPCPECNVRADGYSLGYMCFRNF